MKQRCEELGYTEVCTLLSSDVEVTDWFGISVAVAGNRLVVGAHGEDTAAVSAGKVYIYDWNGTAYVEVTTITASDAQAYGYFGVSVALDGNRLVVGARGVATTAVDGGKVYIYDWNGSDYVEVSTLTASDTQASGYFGVSVAVSGDRLMVGVDGANTIGVDTGKVYVYDWNGTAYVEVAQLTASDAQVTARFGSSVAIDGDGTRLVVGANYEDTAGLAAGKVYVYDRDTGTSTYTEVAQLTASDAQAYDLFGSSVAINGTRLVVGAQLADTAACSAGKVYLYEWNSVTCAYDEVARLTASDAQVSDQFGSSVALSGNRFVVGALGEDTALVNTGKVYVYDLPADRE